MLRQRHPGLTILPNNLLFTSIVFHSAYGNFWKTSFNKLKDFSVAVVEYEPFRKDFLNMSGTKSFAGLSSLMIQRSQKAQKNPKTFWGIDTRFQISWLFLAGAFCTETVGTRDRETYAISYADMISF